MDRIVSATEYAHLAAIFAKWKVMGIRLNVRQNLISTDEGTDYTTTSIVECRMRACYDADEEKTDPGAGTYWWERPNIKRGRILGKDTFSYKLYPRMMAIDINDPSGIINVRPVKPRWLDLDTGWDAPVMGLHWTFSNIAPYSSLVFEYEVTLGFKGQK
jgi:hypothetical protein